MCASISISFFASLLSTRLVRHRRGLLLVAVGINLGILAVFKYLRWILPHYALALPVGISFYTFQAIGYNLDVLQGTIPAEKRLLPYASFITLFPQLIAGPIENYADIGPQLDRPQQSLRNFAEGTRLFTIGLSKKMLLANPMGQLWQALSENPLQNGFLGSWGGLAAFAFQIYFDFSGYSDMARGLGCMLGIRLSHNFDYPYTAASITDFWRRWHITLSRWFRQYVYIPLGGNRRGLARQLLNIVIVWSLTGLWHGASINFVLWGLYYALWLIAEKLFLLRIYRALPQVLRFLPHAVTLIVVLGGWCIFAFEQLPQLALYAGSLWTGPALGSNSGAWLRAFVPLLGCCTLCILPWKWRLSPVLEGLCLALLLVLCVAALAWQGYNPFLYFRF